MTDDDEYNAGARGKVIVQSEIRESVICRRSAALLHIGWDNGKGRGVIVQENY